MEQLKGTIAVLMMLVCASIFAQTEQYNPFKEFDEESKVLTLSDGRYDEFHDQDSIILIGSAIFNTRTLKIVGLVKYDTIYSEATLEPDIISRWLSPDPLAAQFPFVTPYAFVNNSPILFLDPDGQKWVNGYEYHLKQAQSNLLEKPTSRKLKRRLRRVQNKYNRVNEILTQLETNDKQLFDYVDNLKVTEGPLNIERDVEVFVFLGAGLSGSDGETASTSHADRRTAEPDVTYNGDDIVAPLSVLKDRGQLRVGFKVTLYNSESSFSDVNLANEAGDVMYYMEYNADAVNEVGDDVKIKTGGYGEYINTGKGAYSKAVEKKYKERKAESQPREKNPYPLKR